MIADPPSLEEFRRRLAEAGWHELRADEGSAFESWSIELRWAVRVTYNGKDERLGLERETSRDNWRTVWIAEKRCDQTPEALIDALASTTDAPPD